MSADCPLSVICRECAETKHGACDGTAMVERGDDIERVPCICADHGHGVSPVVAHPSDIRTGQRDVDAPAWRDR